MNETTFWLSTEDFYWFKCGLIFCRWFVQNGCWWSTSFSSASLIISDDDDSLLVDRTLSVVLSFFFFEPFCNRDNWLSDRWICWLTSSGIKSWRENGQGRCFAVLHLLSVIETFLVSSRRSSRFPNWGTEIPRSIPVDWSSRSPARDSAEQLAIAPTLSIAECSSHVHRRSTEQTDSPFSFKEIRKKFKPFWSSKRLKKNGERWTLDLVKGLHSNLFLFSDGKDDERLKLFQEIQTSLDDLIHFQLPDPGNWAPSFLLPLLKSMRRNDFLLSSNFLAPNRSIGRFAFKCSASSRKCKESP